MKHLTLEQAKELKRGTILFHLVDKNSDGSSKRWKVNGMPKVWKRDSTRVQVPVKHGLYAHDYITESELNLVSLEGE